MIDQLIIFQKIYNLLLYVYPTVNKFPKGQRFVLSQHIFNTLLEILKLTIIANTKPKRDRIYEQEQISVYLDIFRIYIRLSRDLNFLSIKQYEYIMRCINEIGKLLQGWKKASKG